MVETVAVIIVVMWIIRKVNAHDAVRQTLASMTQAPSQTPPVVPVASPVVAPVTKAPVLAWLMIGGVRYITYVAPDGTRVLVKG